MLLFFPFFPLSLLVRNDPCILHYEYRYKHIFYKKERKQKHSLHSFHIHHVWSSRRHDTQKEKVVCFYACLIMNECVQVVLSGRAPKKVAKKKYSYVKWCQWCYDAQHLLYRIIILYHIMYFCVMRFGNCKKVGSSRTVRETG